MIYRSVKSSNGWDSLHQVRKEHYFDVRFPSSDIFVMLHSYDMTEWCIVIYTSHHPLSLHYVVVKTSDMVPYFDAYTADLTILTSYTCLYLMSDYYTIRITSATCCDTLQCTLLVSIRKNWHGE